MKPKPETKAYLIHVSYLGADCEVVVKHDPVSGGLSARIRSTLYRSDLRGPERQRVCELAKSKWWKSWFKAGRLANLEEVSLTKEKRDE